MTTTPLNISVAVSEPGELLTAIPHLVGFAPQDSLVLLTLNGKPGNARIGAALRTELPCASRRQSFVDYLLDEPLSAQDADAVVAVVIGDRDPLLCQPECDRRCATGMDVDDRHRAGPVEAEEALPHAGLVETLSESVRQANMDFAHALWVPEIRTGAPWRCYRDNDCQGELPDAETSSVAAAMTAAGVVAFRSREELADVVASESDEYLRRRSAKLDELVRERADLEQHNPRSADVRVVFGAIERVSEGGALTEDDFLSVLLAVSDGKVRDIVLSAALGTCSEAAEQLWLTLVRKAPEPEVADVAALLAFSAYLRGDGALASVALERIETCRPEHTLGILLRRALSAGVSPAELATIAQDAAADARIMLAEEDHE